MSERSKLGSRLQLSACRCSVWEMFSCRPLETEPRNCITGKRFMTSAGLYVIAFMFFWLWLDFCPRSLFLQHEVIAVSEKVIVRLEDLVKWTVPDFSGWAHCLKAEPLKQSVLRELGNNGRREALHRYRESTLTSGLNFKDVQRERAQLGECRIFLGRGRGEMEKKLF